MASITDAQPASHLTLLPETERELLRRCAPMRTFDASVADHLVTDGGRVLEAAIENSFVKQVRNRPGTYRLRDDVRRECLESWWAGVPRNVVPPELAELAAELTTFLPPSPATDPADIVGLQLFVNPALALGEWEKLFAQADDRFDIVRCQQLLSLLTWAAISPELEELRERKQAYVTARSFWTAEWYQTSTFVLPSDSKTAFDGLLIDTGGRMQEIRGFGGFGKTMHLRWLIARHCVPAPRCIPCARIDFDRLDPRAAVSDPYLVLLELADQLDRQLPGDAFGRLVSNYSGHRSQLFRRESNPSTARTVVDTHSDVDRLSAAADVVRRFGARLAEEPADRIVLLVLDTLEVPLHLPDTDGKPAIHPLLNVLAKLTSIAACVRVVLAGRYNLDDSLRQLFARRCPPLELPRFTPEEARTYISKRRGIDREDHIDAALTASGGVPFSLALLADLIDTDPGISAKRILSYKGAEYAYLVEKVVKRISERSVRWILRYAAIPRRFDYEFVRDVIWPLVRQGMGGAVELDDPADDDLPDEDEDTDVLWKTGDAPEEGEDTVRAVWEQVKRYATGSSWIAPDRDDINALCLQTEIIQPLRELLGGRPIVAVLHHNASEYFLRQAAEGRPADGGRVDKARTRRQEYLKEAVFHRFQYEGQSAGIWWEEQVGAAVDAETRFALADELARDAAYTDRRAGPVSPGDGLLASLATVQRARLELCLASAELATVELPADGPEPLTDRSLLSRVAGDALKGLEATPVDALPEGRVALARAAVRLMGPSPESAAKDVRAALDGQGASARERLWIALLEARRLAGSDSQKSGAYLEEAARIAEGVREALDLQRMLALELSRHHSDRGDYNKGIAVCAEATKQGLGGTGFDIDRANLLLACGDAEQALLIGQSVADEDPEMLPLARLLQARARRKQYRFLLAAQQAQQALAASQSIGRAGVLTSLHGHSLAEGAISKAAMLSVEEARWTFAEALHAFEDDGDREAAASCQVREAAFLMRKLGHLRAARVTLDHATRSAPDGGRAALMCRLLAAELASRLEDQKAVDDAMVGADSICNTADRPTWTATVAVTSLAFGKRSERDRHADRLGKSLRQITPPTARLRFVKGIERPALVLKEDSAVARRFRAEVFPPDGWDAELEPLAPRDRAVLRLRVAAIHCFLGDNPSAKHMLDSALDEFGESGRSPVELREVVQLARLINDSGLVSQAGQSAMACAETMAEEFPLLAATTAIEYLEAARATGAKVGYPPADLCTRAAEWLSRGAVNMEVWWGRLADLQAAIGDVDDETAKSYRRAAAKLYEVAGDARRASETSNRLSDRANEGRVEVTLSLENNIIKTKTSGWRPSWPWRSTTASGAVRESISSWQRAGGSEPYPPNLPDLMVQDWSGFKLAMADLIHASDAHGRRTDKKDDLAIKVAHHSLQLLPWELASNQRDGRPLAESFRRLYRSPAHATVDTRLVRVVQAGLNLLLGVGLQVDGVNGPSTAQALVDLGTSEQLAKPGAAAVDNSETVQRLHEALLDGAVPRVIIARGAQSDGRRYNLGTERRYVRDLLKPTCVEKAYASNISTLLRTEPPPVIVHVVGGLVGNGGAVAIDLQENADGWRDGHQPGFLTAADLDRALHAVPFDWPAPVVVLDVPLPTGRREAADQLLLRNSFAAELFALGGARAVIATGLAGPRNTEVVQDNLVEGLARGLAIGDIVQNMRRGRDSSFARFDSAMAFAATGLWAHDGSMRLPARHQ